MSISIAIRSFFSHLLHPQSVPAAPTASGPGLGLDNYAGVTAAALPPGAPRGTPGKTLDRPLFPGGKATANQVEQGWIGDCEVASAVMAIAARDPGFFPQYMTQGVDGNVLVETSQFSQGVDRQVYWDRKNNLPYFGDDPTMRSAWYPLLEKAIATQLGGYDALDKHDQDLYVFDLFTGGATRSRDMSETGYARVKAKFDNGAAVIAGSKNPSPLGLIGKHGYAVVAMTDATVTLRNPYGARALKSAEKLQPEPNGVDHGQSPTDGEFTISKADFLANFDWMAASKQAV
jgi:hypothetical protein